MILATGNMHSSYHPMAEVLFKAEIQRTSSRLQEHILRDTQLVSCAIIANTEIMDGKITVTSDLYALSLK